MIECLKLIPPPFEADYFILQRRGARGASRLVTVNQIPGFAKVRSLHSSALDLPVFLRHSKRNREMLFLASQVLKEASLEQTDCSLDRWLPFLAGRDNFDYQIDRPGLNTNLIVTLQSNQVIHRQIVICRVPSRGVRVAIQFLLSASS